jgi:hypothetical protein
MAVMHHQLVAVGVAVEMSMLHLLEAVEMGSQVWS